MIESFALTEVCIGSVGIAVLPAILGSLEVQANRLVAILPEWSLAGMTFFAVYGSKEGLTPKVRVFLDFLEKQIRTGQSPEQVERWRRDQYLVDDLPRGD